MDSYFEIAIRRFFAFENNKATARKSKRIDLYHPILG
jgi:hypothetical protein